MIVCLCYSRQQIYRPSMTRGIWGRAYGLRRTKLNAIDCYEFRRLGREQGPFGAWPARMTEMPTAWRSPSCVMAGFDRLAAERQARRMRAVALRVAFRWARRRVRALLSGR